MTKQNKFESLINYCYENYSYITGCDNCDKNKYCNELFTKPRHAIAFTRNENGVNLKAAVNEFIACCKGELPDD